MDYGGPEFNIIKEKFIANSIKRTNQKNLLGKEGYKFEDHRWLQNNNFSNKNRIKSFKVLKIIPPRLFSGISRIIKA